MYHAHTYGTALYCTVLYTYHIIPYIIKHTNTSSDIHHEWATDRYALHFLAAEEAEGELYSCLPSQLVPVDPATYNQWWNCPPNVIQNTAQGPMKCQFACGKELLVCIYNEV